MSYLVLIIYCCEVQEKSGESEIFEKNVAGYGLRVASYKGMQNIYDEFTISYNGALDNLSGFDNLQYIEGRLLIFTIMQAVAIP